MKVTIAIGVASGTQRDRAQPHDDGVHQPDDGESPGIAPERVHGVGHDLPADAGRDPEQRARGLYHLFGVRRRRPQERAGLVEPGGDPGEDLAVAAEQPADHHPDDDEHDPDREHDDQWGAKPAGQVPSRSTAGRVRPSTHRPSSSASTSSTGQSSTPARRRHVTPQG
jgi:hypothetical protein